VASTEYGMGESMNNARAPAFITYPEYLLTDHWRRIRWAMLWLTGGRCQVCKSEESVEVHHAMPYRDCLYHERPEDLCCLCSRCHALYHADLEGA